MPPKKNANKGSGGGRGARARGPSPDSAVDSPSEYASSPEPEPEPAAPATPLPVPGPPAGGSGAVSGATSGTPRSNRRQQARARAAGPGAWDFTDVPPNPDQRARNGRVTGRTLISWSRPRMAEKLLLNMQIAHRLHPGSSGSAVTQYLGRMRERLVAEGHLVPPIPGSVFKRDVRGYVRRDPESDDLRSTRPVTFAEPLEDRLVSLPDANNLWSTRRKRAHVAARESGEEEEGEEGEDNLAGNKAPPRRRQKPSRRSSGSAHRTLRQNNNRNKDAQTGSPWDGLNQSTTPFASHGSILDTLIGIGKLAGRFLEPEIPSLGKLMPSKTPKITSRRKRSRTSREPPSTGAAPYLLLFFPRKLAPGPLAATRSHSSRGYQMASPLYVLLLFLLLRVTMVIGNHGGAYSHGYWGPIPPHPAAVSHHDPNFPHHPYQPAPYAQHGYSNRDQELHDPRHDQPIQNPYVNPVHNEYGSRPTQPAYLGPPSNHGDIYRHPGGPPGMAFNPPIPQYPTQESHGVPPGGGHWQPPAAAYPQHENPHIPPPADDESVRARIGSGSDWQPEPDSGNADGGDGGGSAGAGDVKYKREGSM
ncbi:hypothetical protein B0I37DRAFT_405784 [Chaetomium sp. MPI-CAGE-AT-0009]|nr:hypothetical protein B0I37DRAFT_405784 [Chaetomium sp. MPI-CAGE-AT-0009]